MTEPPVLQESFVAQPALVELAEEVAARGRQIVALRTEIVRLRAELAELQAAGDEPKEDPDA